MNSSDKSKTTQLLERFRTGNPRPPQTQQKPKNYGLNKPYQQKPQKHGLNIPSQQKSKSGQQKHTRSLKPSSGDEKKDPVKKSPVKPFEEIDMNQRMFDTKVNSLLSECEQVSSSLSDSLSSIKVTPISSNNWYAKEPPVPENSSSVARNMKSNDDILFQWRLKRKLENARKYVNEESALGDFSEPSFGRKSAAQNISKSSVHDNNLNHLNMNPTASNISNNRQFKYQNGSQNTKVSDSNSNYKNFNCLASHTSKKQEHNIFSTNSIETQTNSSLIKQDTKPQEVICSPITINDLRESIKEKEDRSSDLDKTASTTQSGHGSNKNETLAFSDEEETSNNKCKEPKGKNSAEHNKSINKNNNDSTTKEVRQVISKHLFDISEVDSMSDLSVSNGSPSKSSEADFLIKPKSSEVDILDHGINSAEKVAFPGEKIKSSSKSKEPQTTKYNKQLTKELNLKENENKKESETEPTHPGNLVSKSRKSNQDLSKNIVSDNPCCSKSAEIKQSRQNVNSNLSSTPKSTKVKKSTSNACKAHSTTDEATLEMIIKFADEGSDSDDYGGDEVLASLRLKRKQLVARLKQIRELKQNI